jgi:hypothetical protein
MTVHSTQLGYNEAIGPVYTQIYAVPTGKRTIVKGITWQNTASVENRCYLRVTHSGTELWVWIIHVKAIGTDGESLVTTPWIVLNAGDKLEAYCDHANAIVSAHGSELTL